VDRAELFKPRLPQEAIQIPGVGMVLVRGLSRHEAIVMQSVKGVSAQERIMLRFGMVDPEISEEEAGQWQNASPAGEIEPVTMLITKLSGMGPGADKEAYKSLRSGSDDGVRVLPSTEVGPDSGGTPPLDVE